jgi:hypothetical protein
MPVIVAAHGCRENQRRRTMWSAARYETGAEIAVRTGAAKSPIGSERAHRTTLAIAAFRPAC